MFNYACLTRLDHSFEQIYTPQALDVFWAKASERVSGHDLPNEGNVRSSWLKEPVVFDGWVRYEHTHTHMWAIHIISMNFISIYAIWFAKWRGLNQLYGTKDHRYLLP